MKSKISEKNSAESVLLYILFKLPKVKFSIKKFYFIVNILKIYVS